MAMVRDPVFDLSHGFRMKFYKDLGAYLIIFKELNPVLLRSNDASSFSFGKDGWWSLFFDHKDCWVLLDDEGNPDWNNAFHPSWGCAFQAACEYLQPGCAKKKWWPEVTVMAALLGPADW